MTAAAEGMTAEPFPPLLRRSPVALDARPLATESRGGWRVVTRYADEDRGPWLVDLSHRARWDVQDRDVGAAGPVAPAVPATPGEVAVHRGLMVNRMNQTQAAIWHVGPGPAPTTPARVSCTETTDSHAWLAVLGERAPAVMERVTTLDLFPPGRQGPFLTQGPVLHIPCQIVTWAADVVLIAVSRGYGQTFADALLDAARDVRLRPGGERVFTRRAAELGRP